jgi:hypothetical protein
MKKIIRKLYWNPQKEENWLNSLAAKGLSLTDYSWGRYVFQDTEPGEYTYRIELLEKKAQSVESEVYLRFLEESGVEVVSHYWRWVFLRKKTADGPFDLYSDVESRMQYLKRLTRFYLGLTLLEAFVGLGNIPIGITAVFVKPLQDRGSMSSVPFVNLFGGILCLGLGLMFFFALYLPIRSQLRKLKKEKGIFE